MNARYPVTSAADVQAPIARTAFETLLWRFDNPDAEKRRIMLAAELVIRESTATWIVVRREPRQGGVDGVKQLRWIWCTYS